MKVLVKEPGKDPHSMEIVNELDALQDLVGGCIEPIRMTDGLVMIVNEEGKLHGLEPNFFVAALNDTILGTAVFCGEDGEEFTDINEEDLIVLQTFFSIRGQLLEDIRGGK